MIYKKLLFNGESPSNASVGVTSSATTTFIISPLNTHIYTIDSVLNGVANDYVRNVVSGALTYTGSQYRGTWNASLPASWPTSTPLLHPTSQAMTSDGRYLYIALYGHPTYHGTIYRFDMALGYYVVAESTVNTLYPYFGSFVDMCVTADGKQLYALAQWNPTVYPPVAYGIQSFNINASTGSLSNAGLTTLAPPNLYLNTMTIPQDGNHIYVAGNAVEIYCISRNVNTGTLTQLACTIPPKPVASLTTSPDGLFVYGCSNSAPAQIYVYARDHVSGSLTLMSTVTSKTNIVNYSGSCMSPNGAYVYFIGGNAAGTVGMLDVYARTTTTGELTWKSSTVVTSGVVSKVAITSDNVSVYIQSATGIIKLPATQ